MDVTFFESQPYFSSSQTPLQGEIQDKVVSCEDENEEEIWVSSSMIQPKVPELNSSNRWYGEIGEERQTTTGV